MFPTVPFLTLQPLRTTRLSEINYLLIYLYLSKLNLSKEQTEFAHFGKLRFGGMMKSCASKRTFVGAVLIG